jgi:hypothetical protein
MPCQRGKNDRARRKEKEITYRTYRRPRHPTREPKWAGDDDSRGGGHGQRQREERGKKEGRRYD